MPLEPPSQAYCVQLAVHVSTVLIRAKSFTVQNSAYFLSHFLETSFFPVEVRNLEQPKFCSVDLTCAHIIIHG